MIRKEQIFATKTGPVFLNAVACNGFTVNVTTPLTNALTIAGINGITVPLVNSANELLTGCIVTGNNHIKVYSSSTKKEVYALGNLVYGRLTFSAGVYTISFYSRIAGVETAYNTGGAVTFDLIVSYRFTFANAPADNTIKEDQTYFEKGNTATNLGRTIQEAISITATNTFANLTYTPTPGTRVSLSINGKVETNLGGTPPFSMSGNIIGWNATNAGYAAETTDIATATYFTLQ